MRTPLFILLTLLAVLPASAQQKPVVGFLTVDAEQYYAEERETHPYGTRVLLKQGFEFGLFEWRRFFGDQADKQRSLEMLRRFNVCMIDTPFDFSITEIRPAQQRSAAAARQALEQYLTEGGSAFICLQAVRYPGDKDQDYANLVLQGLGVEMLHEGVYDNQRAFKAPIASIFAPEGFFRTENIARQHPVTEGVKRLCLPQYHNGNTPGVVAMKLSPEWQVLVSGEASAASYVVTREHVTDYKAIGTCASAPPIVAVRSFGKGRVLIWSVPARSVFNNFGVPGWNMIVESTGDAKANLPSDGARLTLNGIRWLAEASRGNQSMGTFKGGPPEPVKFPASVEWDSAQFAPPAKGIRGLIGAKTALSDGSGTVADYVAAAKQAGLSFIVFNESLERMTPEKLEQLKAECRVASSNTFYACPGLEFSDDLGNRWAIWSERVIFPQAAFNRAYGVTDEKHPALKQWDGRVMHNPGQFWEYCAYSPNMLLTYRNLRARNAHPANMWWFYRVPPYVYDVDKLVEDQFSEWLFALRDVRLLNPASYTRVHVPSEVARAASVCATGARDLASARDWLNTRCGNFIHAATPYVTGGPLIEQWAAINTQHDLPLDVQGKQRARCRFQVSSPDGIREVQVLNADYGTVRRFLAHGQTTFAQEFELVHDRDHALTLLVTDMKGRRAVSDKVLLFCYKTSLLRCGDNLNFLNGVGLCWHPDRNEMLVLAQGYMGMPVESLRGYDSSSALTRQVGLDLWPLDFVRTKEIPEYPHIPEDGVLRKILNIVLPGNDVKICEMEMGPIVWPFDSPTRDTPARTSVPSVVQENKLFTRQHRATYLQNRNNMFITWDYRRAREGARNYKGGLVWHEGSITFKRDVQLAGPVPIPLLAYYASGSEADTANNLIISDATGNRVITPIPKGQRFNLEGSVPSGGYLTVGPYDIYSAFFALQGSQFRYWAWADEKAGRISRLEVGLGEPGTVVKAGTTFAYRFAMATLGGPRKTPDQTAAELKQIADSFGIGGASPASFFSAGAPESFEVFLNTKAAGNEVCFEVKPALTIVDLPIRVQGVEDNGCAAVYSSARPFFRFVGVAEGAAWFQENVDNGSRIWAGNVFVCDHQAVRMTLVANGLAPGRKPFLELHNPTDNEIRARTSAPPHAPIYGGITKTMVIPAGATIRWELPEKKGE